MLRRDPSAEISTEDSTGPLGPARQQLTAHGGTFVLTPPLGPLLIGPHLEFGPYKRYGLRDNFKIEDSAVQALDEGRDRVSPVYLGANRLKDHRLWWTYRGHFYSTTEELQPDEVKALIEERDNKKKLKISRAKAVAAMADALDDSRRRVPIPRDIKLAVWQRDEGRCVVCGSNESLEYDHVIPLSIGGSDSIRNLQLLCESCNRRKGATLGGEDIPGGRVSEGLRPTRAAWSNDEG
jgi:HNH endonuclease